MKAIVKDTGGLSLKVEGVYLENGYNYSLDEVEIVPEKTDNFSIDWEQRHFELVKAAMQGLLANPETFNEWTEERFDVGKRALLYADAVLAEYRKGGEE